MKRNLQLVKPLRSRRRLAASTLVEMMFASAILVMVIAAMLTAHMIGLREYQLVDSKSGSSDTSRTVLNKLPTDIRSAKMWAIGNGGSNSFSAIANGSTQQGTALRLFSTTNNSTPYIQYYFDLSGSNSSNGKLMRYSSSNSTPVCLASNLVNWLGGGYSFAAENYSGTVTTDATAYKNIIHTRIQFCKFLYPVTDVGGSNALYDYYKIEFRATPHLPE
jgi:hypothetical protein